MAFHITSTDSGCIKKYNIGCEANPTKRKMVHYRPIQGASSIKGYEVHEEAASPLLLALQCF